MDTRRTEPVGQVFDSWRVVDGEVRCIDRHRARFAAAVSEAFGPRAVAAEEIDELFAVAAARTPDAGEWFPRVKALRSAGSSDVAGPVELSFELRPAPMPRATTRLRTARDPRRHPAIKGADAEALAQLREEALAADADDVLFLDGGGAILEAANGAVIAWRDGTILLPDVHAGTVLPSTTVSLIVELAAADRIPIARGALLPQGEDELWYVNGLHTVSPVVAIDGVERRFDAARADAWRARIDARRKPWATGAAVDSTAQVDVRAADAPADGISASDGVAETNGGAPAR